jgi:RES domain
VSPKLTLGEPADLTGFPHAAPPRRLVRVCRASRGTWWFSSDGSGRFDLVAPEGTCYLASDAYAAIREATRLGPVSTQWVRDRELREVAPPSAHARLAATTRLAAGRYGVTAELATVVPYELPRRWAAAFRAHGFDGIRYQPRHDQRTRPSGVALFGNAGERHGDDGKGTALTAGAVEATGVRVLPPPTSAVLTVLR